MAAPGKVGGEWTGEAWFVVAALRAELRFVIVYLIQLRRVLFCNFFMSMQVPATLVSFLLWHSTSRIFFYFFFSGLVMIKRWCLGT